MATIKLGDKTLGSIAFGGTKLGDARRLAKTPIFRTEVFKNHGVKEVVYPSADSIGTGANQPPQTQWLLSNGTWNDNGVWDDSQNWTE
jgi:hypothetical protein